ncbi:hypothetical protein P8452_68889 [Trifolium repens]|jgi:hypothetical protein|nr:hypothetical protein QL285_042318 [Trifolium repens]WJX86600.1 hypothetical protein P8452_68889 [Trifolium repens]
MQELREVNQIAVLLAKAAGACREGEGGYTLDLNNGLLVLVSLFFLLLLCIEILQGLMLLHALASVGCIGVSVQQISVVDGFATISEIDRITRKYGCVVFYLLKLLAVLVLIVLGIVTENVEVAFGRYLGG